MTDFAEIINQILTSTSVEVRPLGDLADIVMGTSPKSDYINTSGEGVEFHQGNSCFEGMKLAPSAKFTTSPVKIASSGSLLMSVRAPVGDLAFTDREVAIGRGVCSIVAKPGVNVKYLYHFISYSITEVKKGRFGSMFESIDSRGVHDIVIRIPSEPIQNMIVEILDDFSNNLSNISAEKDLRTMQYDAYLHTLMNDANKAGIVPLKDCIVKNFGGGTPSKSIKEYWNEGSIPWASVADITCCDIEVSTTTDSITQAGLDNSNASMVEPGMIIAVTRICPGKLVMPTKPIAINQDLRGLILKEGVDPRYVVYYSQTWKIVANGSIVKGITVDTLESMPIALPLLDEQRVIVYQLETLLGMINNLRDELHLRVDQFEYYRDLILSFKGVEI